ncbi:ImmA/IrrE family metallo-endopeptidase [Desemzia sp. C1]|uniref:ImmA/IrrE family metallo-endopeptidase n=1 Tax=Desemzia sp. C1 TaxID=2892016 RepID=UPI001E5883C3|nr:ImmA/IrrE family metallo-endopeptidase [Desemzia sp. C1]
MNEKYHHLISKLRETAGTLNPITIAETLGIEIKYVSFLANPEGQYLKMFDEPIILINEKYAEHNHRYFLVAHELHHAIEHEDLSGYYVQNNVTRGKLENEANAFAAALLVWYYAELNDQLPGSTKELELEFGFPEDLSEEYLTERIY